MNYNVNKKETATWQFIFILSVATFLLSNGFYLKVLEPFLAGKDYTSILGAFLTLTLCTFMWFKKHARIRVAMQGKYGRMILAFFVLIIIPTVLIGSIVTHRQPIIRPSLVVIRVYAGFLFFFWLAVYCNTHRLFLVLHKFIFMFGLSWILISVLFYFSPGFILSIFKTPGQDLFYRLDAPRFVPPVVVRNAMMYTCFFSFVRFSRNKGALNFSWLGVYLLGVFSFLFTLMIRRNGFSLIAIPGIYSLFYLKTSKKILVCYFLLWIVIISTFIFPSLYKQAAWTVESVVTELQSSEKTSSNVRLRAFSYFFPELVNSYFIGYGSYGEDRISQSHRLVHGHEQGYLEADLGIFMALLMYGIPGFLWTLLMYIFIFKDLWGTNSLNAKALPENILIIRTTLLMILAWLVITFQGFVWGFFQAFWWGIFIFLVDYISKFNKMPIALNRSNFS